MRWYIKIRIINTCMRTRIEKSFMKIFRFTSTDAMPSPASDYTNKNIVTEINSIVFWSQFDLSVPKGK